MSHGGGMSMDDSSCESHVSRSPDQGPLHAALTDHRQMLWNWNTIGACRLNNITHWNDSGDDDDLVC